MAPPPPACEPLQVKVTEDWSSGSGRETTTLGPPVTFSRIRVRGAAAASPCENLISSKSTTYRAHPAPCSGPRGPGWACSLPGSPRGLLSTTPGPGEAEPPGLPGVPTGGQSMRVVRPSGCAGNRTGGRGEGEAAVLPTPSHCTVSGGYQVHPPPPPRPGLYHRLHLGPHHRLQGNGPPSPMCSDCSLDHTRALGCIWPPTAPFHKGRSRAL